MSDRDAAKSPTSNFNFPDISKFNQKQADAFMAMQRELSSLVEEANRGWFARVELERDLASDLITKLSTAKTPPEAAKAYQDWMSRRMQTLAQDGQKLFADSQRFIAAATRFLSNGQKPE
jgi:phasin protein